jgi:16S rRNA (guanine527-N7)-methyltransferase
MNQREILTTGAGELGISLTAERVSLLFSYLAELKKWNRKINLTAITEDRDMVIKHLLDSLSYIKGFTPGAGMRLLDMGSGAGFPAIPIRIACPDISITLVESVRKKASFLRHILRTLPLAGAEVLEMRTEEVPDIYENTYSVVTARAFADMNAALAAGMRFLAAGGLMVLSRGPEETVGEQDVAAAGAAVDKRLDLTLPHSNYKRALWTFRKIEK